MRAAAFWLLLPGAELIPELLERTGIARVPDVLGVAAWERFHETSEAIDGVQDQVAPPPHWYLASVCVDPPFQGQGLGSALVRRFADRAAAAGVPACLWTVQPANVPFYSRLGFTLATEGVEEQSGLRYWIFARNPEPLPTRTCHQQAAAFRSEK
jgi:ribosomal protein S18 acetylase RimI-like enzyme